jgi:hypothetical protein
MSILQTTVTAAAMLVGTISGTVLGSVLKSRADRATRVHEWQVTVVTIFGDLMAAVERHYVAMWDLEAARLRGGQDEIEASLAASLTTREAITRPRVQLVVLAPRLRPHVDQAVQAVYAMDTALDEAGRTEDQLKTRRLAAKGKLARLENAMAAVMAGHGAGLPADTHPAKHVNGT